MLGEIAERAGDRPGGGCQAADRRGARTGSTDRWFSVPSMAPTRRRRIAGSWPWRCGLARRVLGTTAPNPAVGAVIVEEATGEMIARGWTPAWWPPHAEAHALERAGAKARAARRCTSRSSRAHTTGVPRRVPTPFVRAGIRRVVCAIEDPNPEISGKGFASLRQAGIAVETGVCAEEARWMAGGHILRMTQGRPFVQLKLAVSADELIAPGDGQPRWVTSGGAQGRMPTCCARRADAILIGRQTVAGR